MYYPGLTKISQDHLLTFPNGWISDREVVFFKKGIFEGCRSTNHLKEFQR
jgi:hypothetical protein